MFRPDNEVNKTIIETISLSPKEPLMSELLDFLQAITTNSTPLVSGEEGLDAVRIVHAGQESMAKSKLIKL